MKKRISILKKRILINTMFPKMDTIDVSPKLIINTKDVLLPPD